MKILAIDQGTTSTRALMIDEQGQSQLLHAVTHRQYHPLPGHVEHDGEELLANIKACINAAAHIGDIAAVGLANQGESCLAWDARTGEPVGPVIVWQDDRTKADIAALEAGGVAAMVRQRAGLPLDAYFSASKLAWILRNNAQAATLLQEGHLRLGTTDAFFRDRLTGRFETDPTTASRTSLMNLATCSWDEDLCALFGVPIEVLPSIRPSTGALGQIAGTALTLNASIVDQQAALYGHGCRVPGDTKITFGTGAFALTVTGSVLQQTDCAALPTIAWQKAGEPPTFALDGGVYAASSAINWARDIGLFETFDQINSFDAEPSVSRGLIFVPALSGLACPHWDRQARGTWMGLSLDTSASDMAQAVLEGIAFRMVEVMADMAEAQTISSPISIDGGLSANSYFCQFLATQLQREILVSQESELTAMGTAAFAAEAVGLTLEVQVCGQRMVPGRRDANHAALFDKARKAVQMFAG